ncbi:MAG: Cystathionine beta-lyase PatB [Chloroflexi bacterium]|nr:Cystathionine beta-lyase PatB [Chloroflexota bacterium]
MNYNFDTIPQRRETDSVKWNFFNEDVLPMWVADMDFLSPSPVIEALRERVEHGVFGYPYLLEVTKEAVVNWLADRHGWQVTPEDLVFLPGVVTGFNLATHAVTEPGQGVLVQTPTYRPFLEVYKNVGREQHAMSLTQDENGLYQVDKEAFKRAIRKNTRVFMLCNPQNPTGRVFRKEELEMMAAFCLENEVVICSDEIHSDLIFSESEHIPIASLDPEIAANTITLLSPSKTFNVAGLKASVAVITNPELRKRFEEARQGLVGWVNSLGQVAAQAAYSEGEAWLKALLVYLEANRDYLVDYVREELPGVQMAKPEGTYLAWLDCREMARETGVENPQQFFLNEAKVGLNNGAWFGKEGRGFMRLNFGCPRALLREGLERMKESVTWLKGKA